MRFFERLGYLARQLVRFLDHAYRPRYRTCSEDFSFH